MSFFRKIPLGDVADPISRETEPIPGVAYRQIGVRLWGGGAYEREPLDGAATKYRCLYRVETNDIIVNKIWARNGSVAVVPENLAGAYGSSEFPTFVMDTNKMDPRWFSWLTKTRQFWAMCDEKSRGTSGKNRIRPEKFLEIEIPLPPLSEQRRIVARIEELASRIEEARRLREEAKVNTEHLVASAVSRKLKHLAERFPLVPLLDICDFQGGSQPPKSMFRNEPAPGYVRFLQIRDFSSDSYLTYIPVSPTNRIAKPDDVLVGRYGASIGKILRGKEGAYSVSICKAIPRLEELSLDFLAIALEFGPFQGRLRTIGRTAQASFNKGDLKGVEYPLPPLDEQYRVVEYVQQLQNGIRRLQYYQSDTSKLIESLLPSILDKAFKGEL